jgi:hypothetical protein
MASVARDVVSPRRCTVCAHGFPEAVCRSPTLRLQSGVTQGSVAATADRTRCEVLSMQRAGHPPHLRSELFTVARLQVRPLVLGALRCRDRRANHVARHLAPAAFHLTDGASSSTHRRASSTGKRPRRPSEQLLLQPAVATCIHESPVYSYSLERE